MIKHYASKMFHSWMHQNQEAVISLLEKSSCVLDVGCGNGELTEVLATTMQPHTLFGMDTIGINKNFPIVNADLNREFPFPDHHFDAVISHYSLEHLYNTGLFISETRRVLKKGGYSVIATDNLSAWPNIAALVCGFQPFSTTTGIGKRALGNPFAIRAIPNNVQNSKLDEAWRNSGEYSHNKVLAYQGLVDAYKEYGFIIEKIIGIGYFPFGGKLSTIFANLDKRHAHFLILKVRAV